MPTRTGTAWPCPAQLLAEETGGAAYSLASCLVGLGKATWTKQRQFFVRSNRLRWRNFQVIPTGVQALPLAQADIAYRRRNYDAARTNLQTVAAVFAKKDGDPYLKRSFETLKASLDRSSPAH